jgi:hypothetical protein
VQKNNNAAESAALRWIADVAARFSRPLRFDQNL